MSRLVWLFSLKSHTQPGVDEAASNHSSHEGGNNFLHVRSLLPYLPYMLTDIIQQMSSSATHIPLPKPRKTSEVLVCHRPQAVVGRRRIVARQRLVALG